MCLILQLLLKQALPHGHHLSTQGHLQFEKYEILFSGFKDVHQLKYVGMLHPAGETERGDGKDRKETVAYKLQIISLKPRIDCTLSAIIDFVHTSRKLLSQFFLTIY